MAIKRVVLNVFVICFLLTGSVLGQELQVAVLPFKTGGYLNIPLRWKTQELLDGVTQMVTDRLANEPDLVLVERERIAEVIREQRFQQSDYVDTRKAVEIGRLLGADILVMGSVNEFGMDTAGGMSLGPFTVKGSRAQVRLSARLISVQTGQILTSIQAKGEKVGATFELDSLKGISVNSEHFRESTLGQALDIAVDDFATRFVAAMERLELDSANTAAEVAVGKIVATTGNYIIVDIGAEQGLAKGDILYVVREESFPGLEKPVRIPVGRLQVVSVEPHACVTTIASTEGGMTMETGDFVLTSDNWNR